MFVPLIGIKKDIQSAEKKRQKFFNYTEEQLLEEATALNGAGEGWFHEQMELLEKKMNEYELAYSWNNRYPHYDREAYRKFREGRDIINIVERQYRHDEQKKMNSEMELNAIIAEFSLDEDRARRIADVAYKLRYKHNACEDSPRAYAQVDVIADLSPVKWERREKAIRIAEILQCWRMRLCIFHEKLEWTRSVHSLNGTEDGRKRLVRPFWEDCEGSQSDLGNSDMISDSSTRTRGRMLPHKEHLQTYESAVAFYSIYFPAALQRLGELLKEK